LAKLKEIGRDSVRRESEEEKGRFVKVNVKGDVLYC
jgi:hypothetical protein